ncbi:MAG: right-handed parallel beta-helix repeat-containing protein [Methylocella sp.]
MSGLYAIQGARNLIRDNRIERGRVGIFMNDEAAPTLHSNRLTDLERLGLLVYQSTERCDISSNRAIRCGTRTDLALGITAIAIFGELNLQSNEVMDTGVAAAGGGVSPRAFGITGLVVLECRVDSNLVTYSRLDFRPPNNGDRALLLQGMLEYEINFGAGSIVIGFAAQITNNKFIGPGATALVELRQTVLPNLIVRFERVMFSGNYCSHFSLPFNPNIRAATVSMAGRMCTVSGNQVKAATPDFRSYDLHRMPGPFIGNISHGPTWDRPTITEWFPKPELDYNLNA